MEYTELYHLEPPYTENCLSNDTWTIYGYCLEREDILAHPKCLPYPMFLTVRFLPGGVFEDDTFTGSIDLLYLPGTSIPFYDGLLTLLTEWSHDIINFEDVCSALPFLGSGINMTVNKGGLWCQICHSERVPRTDIRAPLAAKPLNMGSYTIFTSRDVGNLKIRPKHLSLYGTFGVYQPYEILP